MHNPYISCVPLSCVTNTKHFEKAVEDGWINVRQHPTDNHLIICCYSTRCQIEGHWVKDTTMLARGLILYQPTPDSFKDAKIISRGIPKFFTIDAIQSDSDWSKLKLIDDDENIVVSDNIKIPFNSPAFIADKLDGALGVGYPYDGAFRVSTKGSFSSDEANIGNRIMNRKVSKHHHTKGEMLYSLFAIDDILYEYTPLFEIITPNLPTNQRHVIDYGNIENLFFLGIVNNSTGKWHPVQELKENEEFKHSSFAHLDEICGFGIPITMSYDTLSEALLAPEILNKEGMVATINEDEQHIYKIKYPSFLKKQAIHHMTGHAKRDIMEKINPSVMINSDYKTAIKNAVNMLFPDEDIDWKNLIETRFLELTEETYFKPLNKLWNNTLHNIKQHNLLSYQPFDNPGNKKQFAMLILDLEKSNKISAIEKAALFCIPKSVENKKLDKELLLKQVIRIANNNFKY